MVKISVKNVTKTFKSKNKNVVALDNINLEIESGDAFGIVGPSGAGKTTLMRIIAGLDVPTSGEVLFNENVVSKDGKILIPPEKRNIGMVFQNWALYPNLTAFENIAFPLQSQKLPEGQIRQKVQEIAEILGITHVLSHYPREISGGQQQRVALARALVKSPSILVLDEPFSNLDAPIRDSARALVKKLQEKFNVTTLIVSHDPADIFAIASRAAVLVNGKIDQIGSPIEIYNNPVSLQVAKLVGEIVTGKGVVTSVDGKKVIKCGNLIFQAFMESSINDSDEVEFGLRPEDVKIAKDNKLEGFELAGKVVVKVSSYSGGAFKIIVSPLENEEIELYALSDTPMKVGEVVNLFYRKEKIKVFLKNHYLKKSEIGS